MGHNEHFADTTVEDRIKALRALQDAAVLSDMQSGIADQIIDRGLDSLSKKQGFVFETYIWPLALAPCARCGDDAVNLSEDDQERLSDQYAEGSDALCEYCEHMSTKDD